MKRNRLGQFSSQETTDENRPILEFNFPWKLFYLFLGFLAAFILILPWIGLIIGRMSVTSYINEAWSFFTCDCSNSCSPRSSQWSSKSKEY